MRPPRIDLGVPPAPRRSTGVSRLAFVEGTCDDRAMMDDDDDDDDLDGTSCPHCGATLRAGATFCRHCGATPESGWNDDDEGLAEGGYGEDDFDYDDYVEREFPDRAPPKSAAQRWQRGVLAGLVVLTVISIVLLERPSSPVVPPRVENGLRIAGPAQVSVGEGAPLIVEASGAAPAGAGRWSLAPVDGAQVQDEGRVHDSLQAIFRAQRPGRYVVRVNWGGLDAEMMIEALGDP